MEDRQQSLKMPDWFPKALAVARHEDEKQRWHPFARFLHQVLVSWRCPCCIEARRNDAMVH